MSGFSQLRAFDVVALTGSFSLAAEHLHITQPAVTIQVRMLDTREAMREAIINGFGIGFLFERELVNDQRCVAIPVIGSEDTNCDTIVCHKRHHHRPAGSAMMELAETI